jgi:hypothetical protein
MYNCGQTRIGIYKTFASSTVSYAGEPRAVGRSDERMLTSAEICLMGRAAGYGLWDRKRGEEIMKEVRIPELTELIAKTRRNWKKRVDRMSSDRSPKKKS